MTPTKSTIIQELEKHQREHNLEKKLILPKKGEVRCGVCGLRILSSEQKAEHLRLAKSVAKKPYRMPSQEENELLAFVDNYKNKGYCSQQFVLAGIAFMEHIPKPFRLTSDAVVKSIGELIDEYLDALHNYCEKSNIVHFKDTDKKVVLEGYYEQIGNGENMKKLKKFNVLSIVIEAESNEEARRIFNRNISIKLQSVKP